MIVTMKTIVLLSFIELFLYARRSVKNFFNSLMKLILLTDTGVLERLSILFKDTLAVYSDLISKLVLLSTAVLFSLF